MSYLRFSQLANHKDKRTSTQSLASSSTSSSMSAMLSKKQEVLEQRNKQNIDSKQRQIESLRKKMDSINKQYQDLQKRKSKHSQSRSGDRLSRKRTFVDARSISATPILSRTISSASSAPNSSNLNRKYKQLEHKYARIKEHHLASKVNNATKENDTKGQIKSLQNELSTINEKFKLYQNVASNRNAVHPKTFHRRLHEIDRDHSLNNLLHLMPVPKCERKHFGQLQAKTNKKSLINERFSSEIKELESDQEQFVRDALKKKSLKRAENIRIMQQRLDDQERNNVQLRDNIRKAKESQTNVSSSPNTENIDRKYKAMEKKFCKIKHFQQASTAKHAMKEAAQQREVEELQRKINEKYVGINELKANLRGNQETEKREETGEEIEFEQRYKGFIENNQNEQKQIPQLLQHRAKSIEDMEKRLRDQEQKNIEFRQNIHKLKEAQMFGAENMSGLIDTLQGVKESHVERKTHHNRQFKREYKEEDNLSRVDQDIVTIVGGEQRFEGKTLIVTKDYVKIDDEEIVYKDILKIADYIYDDGRWVILTNYGAICIISSSDEARERILSGIRANQYYEQMLIGRVVSAYNDRNSHIPDEEYIQRFRQGDKEGLTLTKAALQKFNCF